MFLSVVTAYCRGAGGSAFAVALVVALLLPAPRLRRSPPACPRTVRLRRFAPLRTVRPCPRISRLSSDFCWPLCECSKPCGLRTSCRCVDGVDPIQLTLRASPPASRVTTVRMMAARGSATIGVSGTITSSSLRNARSNTSAGERNSLRAAQRIVGNRKRAVHAPCIARSERHADRATCSGCDSRNASIGLNKVSARDNTGDAEC